MPPVPPIARSPDPDPDLGQAAERQATFATQATGFDFRDAVAASGRRSLLLILGLTAAAVLVGAIFSGGVLFGLLDRARNEVSGEEVSWAIMGTLGFGALSLLAAWIRLRGANARILEQQGTIEVLPDDPAVRGDPLLRRLWNGTEEAALAARLRPYISDLASAIQRISENPRVARADHAVAEVYVLSPFGSSLVYRLLSTHSPTEKRIARLCDLRAD